MIKLLKKLFGFGSALKKEQVFLGIFFMLVLVILPLPAKAGVEEAVVAFLSNKVLEIMAWLMGLAGLMLNGVIYYTVVKMADSYGSIPAISVTWGLIRDLANMSFIFILLFAAIKTILGVGGDNKRLIINLVIAAILINFSMLFTEIIIDAGNLIAVLLYDVIAPGALSQAGNGFDFTNPGKFGLSNSFMQFLNLQSLYNLATASKVGSGQIIIVGLFGAVLILIAAFCFFAISLLLIIRYAVLMLLLIFSPVAALSKLSPGLNSKFKEWWNALLGQTFFAPIYFFLTLVSLHLLAGITSSAFGINMTNANLALSGISGSGAVKDAPSYIPLILSYCVVIIFMITSLIVAKNWANMAGKGVASATKWAMGAAGGATLGMAGWAGRKTIGAGASSLSDSERLKNAAAQGGAKGMAARLALATSRKTAGASFDMRATAMGKKLDAGKAQKGGYSEDVKKSAEKMKKFGESLGPSAFIASEAKQARDNAKREFGENSDQYKAAQREVDRIEGIDKKEADKRKNALNSKIKSKEEEAAKIQEQMNNTVDPSQKEALRQEYMKTRNEAEDMRVEMQAIKEVDGLGKQRKESYAQAITEKNFIGQNQVPFLRKIKKSHRQAAADLRKGGKKAEDLVKDLMKATGELKDEEKPQEENAGGGEPKKEEPKA